MWWSGEGKGTSGADMDEKDLCLLTDAELLRLVRPEACGYLFRKSSVTGWHRHWYSLRGSQLFYFEREKGRMRRGALMVSSPHTLRLGFYS